MNRNTESHFSQIPHANIHRAMFDRSTTHLTTLNEGDLVPIYVDEILPGDTIKMKTNLVCRMMTPLYPVMDNCYMDIYWFAVPRRLTWEHWEEFMGENKSSYWAETTEYTIPQITAPTGGWTKGTIADYMGIPTNVSNLSIDANYMRAYALIWNEWFRDQNLQQPLTVSTDDATQAGVNTGTGQTYAELGGLPAKVSKYHDYFTSCLPEPQKGTAAQVGLDLSSATVTLGAPITQTISDLDTTGRMDLILDGNENLISYINSSGTGEVEKHSDTAQIYPYLGIEDNNLVLYHNNESDLELIIPNKIGLKSTNATIEASTLLTINELRQAIAVQHLLENDARGGTRYRELLKSHFGCTSPDERMQIPEYLGGTRVPIQVRQVIQQSSTDSTSPQGNTAAYSLTTMSKDMFTYSSTEHAMLIGLAAIRVDHSYQQGLERFWSRKDRTDFYWPELENLGEMAVLNKEIYAQGTDEDDEVFGYQEAWADYKYKPSRVSSAMRSNYSTSLDAWHYADYYESLPTLSSSWMQEDTENIDRTIAVTTDLENQFLADFYFEGTWTRPMSVYSIPGLSTI